MLRKWIKKTGQLISLGAGKNLKKAHQKKIMKLNFSKELTAEEAGVLTQLLRTKKQESLSKGEKFLELPVGSEYDIEYDGKNFLVKLNRLIIEYKGDNKKQEKAGGRYKVMEKFIGQGGEGAVSASEITIQLPEDLGQQVKLEKKQSALKRVEFKGTEDERNSQKRDLKNEAKMGKAAKQMKTKGEPVFFEDYAYLVMAKGGIDLLEAMNKYKTIIERFQLMIKTLEMYLLLRKEDIVHHDLKPENLLLNNLNPKEVFLENCEIKAIDLSHAKFAGEMHNKYFWATQDYAPPELYDHITTLKSDIFSIAFILISIARNGTPKITERTKLEKWDDEGNINEEWKEDLYKSSMLDESDLFAGAKISKNNPGTIHAKDKKQVARILAYMANSYILFRLPPRKIEDVILVLKGILEKMKNPKYDGKTFFEDEENVFNALERIFDGDHGAYGESVDKYDLEIIFNRMLKQDYKGFFVCRSDNRKIERQLKKDEAAVFRHVLMQLFESKNLEKIKTIIDKQSNEGVSKLATDLKVLYKESNNQALTYFITICNICRPWDSVNIVDLFSDSDKNQNQKQKELITNALIKLVKLDEKDLIHATLELIFKDNHVAIRNLHIACKSLNDVLANIIENYFSSITTNKEESNIENKEVKSSEASTTFILGAIGTSEEQVKSVIISEQEIKGSALTLSGSSSLNMFEPQRKSDLKTTHGEKVVGIVRSPSGMIVPS